MADDERVDAASWTHDRSRAVREYVRQVQIRPDPNKIRDEQMFLGMLDVLEAQAEQICQLKASLPKKGLVDGESRWRWICSGLARGESAVAFILKADLSGDYVEPVYFTKNDDVNGALLALEISRSGCVLESYDLKLEFSLLKGRADAYAKDAHPSVVDQSKAEDLRKESKYFSAKHLRDTLQDYEDARDKARLELAMLRHTHDDLVARHAALLVERERALAAVTAADVPGDASNQDLGERVWRMATKLAGPLESLPEERKLRVLFAVALWKLQGKWHVYGEGYGDPMSKKAVKDNAFHSIVDNGTNDGEPLHWRFVEAVVSLPEETEPTSTGKELPEEG